MTGSPRIPNRPNILLVFPDQWRGDWTEANPELPLRTPNFMRLCRRGVRFARAITPSPLCASARAALASGLEFDRCGVQEGDRDYPVEQPTFYARLRDAGYHVMGCGKFDLAKSSYSWKIDGSSHLREWGFSEGVDCEGKWDAVNSARSEPKGPYMAFLEGQGLRAQFIEDMDRRAAAWPFDSWPAPIPEHAYGDNWVGEKALALLSGAPSDRPWFLQVNFLGPHDPWDITPEMAGLYAREQFAVPLGTPPGDIEKHQAVRRNYAAMIENLDGWIGRLESRLRAMGQLANTLIVVSSDHGEMLGERGRWGKHLPAQASIDVPLVFAGPDVAAGGIVKAGTTILDLAATFVEIAGAEPIAGWDSRSLKSQLENPAAPPPRSHVFSAYQKWRLVFDGRYKLILRNERRRLLDLERDPQEQVNLAEADPGRLAELLHVIEAHEARSSGGPRAP